MNYEIELETAIDAVIKACHLCMTVQSEMLSKDKITKEDKTPVTVADYGAQAVICHELDRVFPDDPVVGEEDTTELRKDNGKALRSGITRYVTAVIPGLTEEQVLDAIDKGNYKGGPRGRHWTLDPIDGTKGFLRGEQYSVALALIEDGEVVLGVLGCPDLPLDLNNPHSPRGCVLSAVRGQGAMQRLLDGTEEKSISVSTIEEARNASFCESVESAHSSHGDSEKVAEILGVTREPIRIDSQCKYAVIARGDASIYLRLPTRKDYQEYIWDHAAGSIIVKEAGGRASDIKGKDLDFSLGMKLSQNLGIVGTNGSLHEPVISAIGEVLGAE